MIIVDRIENDIAAVEINDGSIIEIPVSRLPEGAKAGSILRETEDGYILDKYADMANRKINVERTKLVFNKKK